MAIALAVRLGAQDSPQPGSLPGEEPRPPRRGPKAEAPLVPFGAGTPLMYLVGNVSWEYEYRGDTVYVKADRMLVHPRQATGEEAEPESDTKRVQEGEETVDIGSLGKFRDFSFYAEGVRIDVPARATHFEAESFYYEHGTGRGVGRNVRIKTTFENVEGMTSLFSRQSSSKVGVTAADGLDFDRDQREDPYLRTPLIVRGEVMRLQDFEVFQGENVSFTTCDYGIPHYAIGAHTVEVQPVRDEDEGQAPTAEGEGPADLPSTAEEDPRAPKAFVIDPEDARFTLSGHTVAALPIAKWDTRWHANLPVRSVDVGSSSKFGFIGGADWNLNYFLSALPDSKAVDVIQREARLGFETHYFSKRGVGLGPHVQYGQRPRSWMPWQLQLTQWNYYGEAQYYGIDDQGSEDRTTGLPPPKQNRLWGHLLHRQAIPYVGYVDVEFSKLSDRAFLREYFEDVAQEEKRQETIIYYRRNILDNLAVTGLYKPHINDFETDVERLPEAKVFLFQQEVLDSNLYTDLNLQAAQLRRDDDALGGPTRASTRFDVVNEWAYPLDTFEPYVQLRPFALLRYTEYSEVLNPSEGAEDRTSLGAGIAASQQWSRVHSFQPDSIAARVFGLPTLKHNIEPKVTYTNVFVNDLPPQDLIDFDETDTVDLREGVDFSLRNEVLARRRIPGSVKKVKPLLGRRDLLLETVPYDTYRLLDSSVRFTLFPRSKRDNSGDVSSLLIFDNTARVFPRTFLRAWFELNPNKSLHADRIATSLTYRPSDELSFTLGDRFTKSRSNIGFVWLNWRLHEKWRVDVYYSRDFEHNEDVEYNVVLNRIFHRFALAIQYSEDVRGGRNRSISVNFSPLELLRPTRRGYR